LPKPFSQPEGWYYKEYGYVLGYNYLGGHLDTPWPKFREFNGWISPQKTTDSPSLVLLSDLNDWSPGYAKTFVPHGNNGPKLLDTESANSEEAGLSSKEAGARGGNVGYLDGSVRWVRIERMKAYRASRLWGSGGCFGYW
jgi:prepilin-type processing-associated H-X9-DG protein